MSINDQLLSEFISAIFNVVILFIGAVVVNRLSVRISTEWAIRQKKKEIELETAREFYKIYGEFFAIWKLWSYQKEQNIQNNARWTLLERVAFAEGSLESILVKLTSERNLSKVEIETLARFRQGYQTLRESIRDDSYLGWSKDKNAEYVSFKRLAGLVSDIILKDKISDGQNHSRGTNALMEITSNTWEGTWSMSDEEWKRLQSDSGLKK